MSTLMQSAIHQIDQELRAAAEALGDNVPLKRVTNEWEVVFLLGVLTAHCNIKLVSGSGSFPDALLLVEVDTTPVEVRTELECWAQDFNRHGHNPLGCDLVLSYYQDREMIGDVPVLALQKYLPNLVMEKVVTIQHEDKPEAIQTIFDQFDQLVRYWKLSPSTSAKDRGFTNSHPYTKNGKVLCRVQYLNRDYVQFTWRQTVLSDYGVNEEVGRVIDELGQALAGRTSHVKVTATEYKLNVYPDDMDILSYICTFVQKTLAIIFDDQQYKETP